MIRFIQSTLSRLDERRRLRRRAANLRAGASGRHAGQPRAGNARGQATPAPRAATRSTALPGAAAFLRARGRDLRAALSGSSGPVWIAGLTAAVLGAGILAGHARHLDAATERGAHAPDALRAAAVYQAALPGAVIDVPAAPGVSIALQEGGAVLVAAGMQAARPVRIDLCSQLLDPARPRLSPLRLGYRFEDVRRWVAQRQAGGSPLTLRNVLLVDDPAPGEAMPEVQISGMATPDFASAQSQPLQLSWRSAAGAARWIGDASLGQAAQGASGDVGLRQQGWLTWRDGAAALRIERRASAVCPQAGELLVQLYRPATPASALQAASLDGARALVVAFPARGKAQSAYLAPGRYQVPAAPGGGLEDQALFEGLRERGLLRLAMDGSIAVAPRDLAQWRLAAPAARAADLATWRDVALDKEALKLMKRLYRQADGAYVRAQIDIFNGELRLLAWRIRSGSQQAALWQASSAGVPLAAMAQMPVAAARLFADVPQGWQPWQRAGDWPSASAGRVAQLTLPLARPAAGGERLELLLVGRAGAAEGARVAVTPACSGRACPSPDAAQLLELTLLPGARAVSINVSPLSAAALGGQGDQQYRHLRVIDGRLVWQALDARAARPVVPSPVRLEDRNGALLWADGAPTQPAIAAGLAPLLGVNAEQGGSVAGMLSRLPRPGDARLTLDLDWQRMAQGALDCVGMRRGRWDGAACNGGEIAPAGRHAGLVLLDAETGDVLVAAGAGTGAVNAANWSEVRDFDQTNPARSPLRLPAFQHDGGAHQSPGSTFKVISSLGLELAAKDDTRIDRLLDGMPLAALNRLARERGYAFQTEAATYPFDADVHITNYKEQSLDRRAQDGRLGLAQAITYSLNTWFAWSGELSDKSLFGRPDGGAPDLQALDPDALDAVRPILNAAHRLGFEQALRLDGGLLPADFPWATWDALQATPAHIDPVHTRHELRQMAIGLRMQATPLQMALAAAAVGQGKIVAPRLLLSLDGKDSSVPVMPDLGIRLDRIRAGMKGVIDVGTGAGAFRAPQFAQLRAGFYGKTGTAPSFVTQPDGSRRELATVWFTGYLEPGSLPGQRHRLAVAAFVSHSEASGGDHAAPVVAALLSQVLAHGGGVTPSSPSLPGPVRLAAAEQRVK